MKRVSSFAAAWRLRVSLFAGVSGAFVARASPFGWRGVSARCEGRVFGSEALGARLGAAHASLLSGGAASRCAARRGEESPFRLAASRRGARHAVEIFFFGGLGATRVSPLAGRFFACKLVSRAIGCSACCCCGYGAYNVWTLPFTIAELTPLAKNNRFGRRGGRAGRQEGAHASSAC